ncbi:flagellar basal body rod protein FlgB [Xanthobacter sp. V4C-4]|uniref:flagellar basal body rod protein FlgB n=1 Tax=Xanthobacter cornucopiae TaxID=3119924 RepID=UPI003727007D
MQPLFLFGLASSHAQWASVRQTAIAGNIANANTPGYKAVDAVAFDAVMNQTQLALTRTSQNHLQTATVDVPTRTLAASDSWGSNNSGNNVSIEQEMLKAGEVNRAYTLDTSIVRSFHRMLLSGLK